MNSFFSSRVGKRILGFGAAGVIAIGAISVLSWQGQENLDRAMEHVRDLVARLSGVGAERDELELALADKTDRYYSVTADKNYALGTIEDLETQIEYLESQLEFERENAIDPAEIGRLESIIADLNSQILNYREQVAQLESEIASQSIEINDLRAALALANSQIEEANRATGVFLEDLEQEMQLVDGIHPREREEENNDGVQDNEVEVTLAEAVTESIRRELIANADQYGITENVVVEFIGIGNHHSNRFKITDTTPAPADRWTNHSHRRNQVRLAVTAGANKALETYGLHSNNAWFVAGENVDSESGSATIILDTDIPFLGYE